MENLLTNPQPATIGPWKLETDFDEKRERILQAILNAKKKIRQEIREYKDRLKNAKETITKFKNEIGT
ncbi:YEATS domain-containing protein 4-like [Bemisia tabaci]|uniref:YEATS domain-containing protein 4-like n=1 Tax=Bemisia tabaci TaxID=7038 RepID=UPI003B285E74